MPNTGKRTVHKKTRYSVCTTTLQHMQGNSGTIAQKHWCEHVPKSVETSQGSKVTVLWNQQIQTDRTIPNNKPRHYNP